MGQETRVFGPPGTGKTTYLSGAVRATARARRTSRLTVGSFTVAAAREIGGRNLPIPASQVGTLHALAYRAIDRPELVVEHIEEWNKRHPALALPTNIFNGGAVVEGPTGQAPRDGGRLFNELETLRARCTSRADWPQPVRRFSDAWSAWKEDEDLVDFTDMIERATDTTTTAPGSPVVGFFDEVQDFTQLELRLVRHWGKEMDRLVLAGDDDQCLYSFKGAHPDAFLDPPLPPEQKRILGQSYRLPAAVHAVSQRWVERLSRREPKEYKPRDAEGLVREGTYGYRYPEALLADLETQLDSGRTVMLLATCTYMLDSIKRVLRARGIPFHNPYVGGRGDWNPLGARGTTAAQRLVSYLVPDERTFGDMSHLWTGEDMANWIPVVRQQGILKRGAKTKVTGFVPTSEVSYEDVLSLFDVPAEMLDEILEPSIDWFESALLDSARGSFSYPLTIARRRGPVSLVRPPQVTIGTIHSVKGGESDVVYLFPDISAAAMREWAGPAASRDPVIRQMYVGMTQAREELVICQPSTQLTVDPSLLMLSKEE